MSAVMEFIQHHGVKGMKWGVRRDRSGTVVSTKRTRYSKAPGNLTMEQLNRRIKRMETEKRYNDLNKRDVSQGEKIATEILTQVGKNVAINIGTKIGVGIGMRAVEKQFAKRIGLEEAQRFLKTKKK